MGMQNNQTRIMLAIMAIGAVVAIACVALPWTTAHFNTADGGDIDATLSGIDLMTDTQGLEMSYAPAVIAIFGVLVLVLSLYSWHKGMDTASSSIAFTVMVVLAVILITRAGDSPLYVAESMAETIPGLSGSTLHVGIPDWITDMAGQELSTARFSGGYGGWVGTIGLFISWIAAVNAYRIRKSMM